MYALCFGGVLIVAVGFRSCTLPKTLPGLLVSLLSCLLCLALTLPRALSFAPGLTRAFRFRCLPTWQEETQGSRVVELV